MAWGFAQLEGCILIYSNWNGKATMTRTLTFILRHSQAGSELTTRIALWPKGKEERRRRKSAADFIQLGWIPFYLNSSTLVLHPNSWDIKENQYSGCAIQVTHLGWVIFYQWKLPSLVAWIRKVVYNSTGTRAAVSEVIDVDNVMKGDGTEWKALKA